MSIFQIQKVAIVGRTNAGKSTLFNKLISKKHAITSKIRETTRDANQATCEWRGKEFILYDTAGSDIKIKDEIDKQVIEQSQNLIAKSDLIIFLLDGKEEMLPQDIKIARELRKIRTPIILAINKIDNAKIRKNTDLFEFEALGFGKPNPISAISGIGTGDLLDVIVAELKKIKPKKKIKKDEIKIEKTKKIKIAIVGRPNVGKSSILNGLLKRKVDIKNQEEIIVSDIAHTTREPQKRKITGKDSLLEFSDTAGIRRKTKTDRKGLEILSVKKSITTLKQADIALFIIDIHEPITSQDQKLASLIIKNNVSAIIIANKWDLISGKDTGSDKEYSENLRASLPHLKWAPIIFTSAIIGKNINKITDLVEEISVERVKKIPNEELKIFIEKVIHLHHPVKRKGANHPHIKSFSQTDVASPQFVVKIKKNDTLSFAYLKFIEKKLREEYGFIGSPVQIKVGN
ncbi:MAG: ribosome biogenesis GTPase Der [Patescibacteria group bacterium]|nr:ribosome biogenesis GTPase Der [Patescibacteria group bacterium]